MTKPQRTFSSLQQQRFNLRSLLSRTYYSIPFWSYHRKRSFALWVRGYLNAIGFSHKVGAFSEPSSLASKSASTTQPSDPFAFRRLPVEPLRLLFLGHDAARAGAQMVLLHLMRWLKRHAWVDMRLLLLEGGDLLSEFEVLAPTYLIGQLPTNSRLENLRYLMGGKIDLIYGNSAVAAQAYGWLSALGAPILTHVHELEQSLQRFANQETLQLMLRHTDHYIAASRPVLENLIANHGIDPNRGTTIHAFIEPLDQEPPTATSRSATRATLGLADGDMLVFGCGTRDWRKGADLFVEVARQVLEQQPDVHFCWIGDGTDGRIPPMDQMITRYGLKNRVHLLPPQQNPRALFRAGNLFLLTSREDPFPLVCLEAAECGLPILCFEGAGGMAQFVADDIGFSVPFEDVRLMAAKVLSLVRDPLLTGQLGKAARAKLLATHISDLEAPRILDLCRALARKPHPLSVIVPNYNCAPYLEQRFESIFQQTFRDYEVIVLDDASTDASLATIQRYSDRGGTKLALNRQNSGSPFKQWQKGLEMARGDWVWIAESDDFCAPTFLDRLLASCTDSDVVLAYCQSVPVGPDSAPLGPNYLDWTDDLDTERWRYPYRATGQEELDLALGQKNAIINASAVLMRRVPALTAVADAIPFRFAGDWITYAGIARFGDVVFVPDALNRHRRHPTANTSKMLGTLDWLAEDLAVKAWLTQKKLIRGNPALQTLCRTLAFYEGNVRPQLNGKPDLLTDPALQSACELAHLALEAACGGSNREDRVLVVADNAADGWTAAIRRCDELIARGKQVFVVVVTPQTAKASQQALPDGAWLLEGTLGPMAWYERAVQVTGTANQPDSHACRLQTINQMCRLLGILSASPCGDHANRFISLLSRQGALIKPLDSPSP